MRSSDNYLVNVLDKLEKNLGLLDDTLIIRTADHGEMGLTHGGMRQKNFNFYEEATRVPLVLEPEALSGAGPADALVSHVDFLPTLASLAGAPKPAQANWEGVDYSPLVLRPKSAKPVQDYVVFTYDDFQSGQAHGPYPKPPNHIVSIREGRWKLAKYYDVNGNKRPQWEMYDLKTDPAEKTNLAYEGYERSEAEEKQFQRLKRKLARVEKTRLKPLS